MKSGIVIAIALLAAGCSGPKVTGNSQGGAMPWFATNTENAFNAAQAHCQKYGKDARITQMVPIAGGSVAFDCVKG